MSTTITDVLDQVRANDIELQAKTAAEFDAIVHALADGETPSPEDVRRVLAAANLTVDDLARAAQLEIDRRKAQAKAEAKPGAIKRMREIEAELKTRREAIEKQRQQELDALQPLCDEFRRQEGIRNAGDLAETMLRRTWNDSTLARREKMLRAENMQLQNRRKEIEKLLESFDSPGELAVQPGHNYGDGLYAQWTRAKRILADLQEHQTSVKRRGNDRAAAAIAAEVTAAEKAFAAVDGRVKSLRAELERNKARKAEIERECEAIDAAKLRA